MILYLFLIGLFPLSRHPLWSGQVGELTVIKYIGGACMVYALWYVGSKQAMPPFLRSWPARWFALFMGMAFGSYAFLGRGFSWQFSPVLLFVAIVAAFLLTIALVDSVRRMRWVMLAMAASVVVGSAYVIREWQQMRHIYMGYRPGWVVGDSNYFSLSALFTIPISYMLLTRGRDIKERVFGAGTLLATLAAFLLASSRGGFLGLVASSAFIVWTSPKRVKNALLLAVLSVPLILLPGSPAQRLMNPGGGDEVATQERKVSWAAGWNMIGRHPVTGIGLGNFKADMLDYVDTEARALMAHNSYIEIAAELGLPGLLVFVLALASAFRSLSRVRSAGGDLGWLAQALQAGLLGGAVAIVFLSGQYNKFLWLVVALAACAEHLRRTQDPSPASPRPIALPHLEAHHEPAAAIR